MPAILLELADLQCSYDDIDLPCSLCSEKGLRCTAADKIWGPKRELRQLEIEKQNKRSMTRQRGDILSDNDIIEIIPRQFPTPDEVLSTQLEAKYIQYFYENILDIYLISYSEDLLRNVPRFRPNPSSKAVRYALMLLSLKSLDGKGLISEDENKIKQFEFRALYCHHASEAIENHAYADILNACYMMCIYAVDANLPLDEFIKHFRGFLLVVERLVTSGGISQTEMSYFLWMFLDIMLRIFCNRPRKLYYVSARIVLRKYADDIEVVASNQRTSSRIGLVFSYRYCLSKFPFVTLSGVSRDGVRYRPEVSYDRSVT